MRRKGGKAGENYKNEIPCLTLPQVGAITYRAAIYGVCRAGRSPRSRSDGVYVGEDRTLRCPKCSCNSDRVLETREIAESSVIRRRRECETCGTRFTTYERAACQQVMVRKRSGRLEVFQREKLFRGIEKACVNRPIGEDEIRSLVQEIEYRISSRPGGEVSSIELGEAVLSRLKEVDPVAYVRFASVYKRFGDPNDFFAELALLSEVGSGAAGASQKASTN